MGNDCMEYMPCKEILTSKKVIEDEISEIDENEPEESRNLRHALRYKIKAKNLLITIFEIPDEEFNKILEGNSSYYRIINQLQPKLQQIQFDSDTVYRNMNCYKIKYLGETQYYKGCFNSNGECTGEGIWTDNYNTYYGNFSHDKFSGEGVFINARGDYYFGEWSSGKPNGRGIIVLNGLIAYDGDFIDGQKSGMGKECFPDGTNYEGQFYMGQKNGLGKYDFLGGNVYEGTFKNSKFCGEGIYTWNNGKRFKGMFNNGKMNGEGTFLWKDGASYTGHYTNNVKQGEGQFRWADGTMLQGNWNNNVPNGNAVFLDPNRNIRENFNYFGGRPSNIIA